MKMHVKMLCAKMAAILPRGDESTQETFDIKTEMPTQ